MISLSYGLICKPRVIILKNINARINALNFSKLRKTEILIYSKKYFWRYNLAPSPLEELSQSRIHFKMLISSYKSFHNNIKYTFKSTKYRAFHFNLSSFISHVGLLIWLKCTMVYLPVCWRDLDTKARKKIITSAFTHFKCFEDF